ncbi:hypothetical protein PQX77_017851 [Marasmius sp. AFHP31]|nr:hypothetical protein PQX77_017851 [Marasmius sp. AFHP31]
MEGSSASGRPDVDGNSHSVAPRNLKDLPLPTQPPYTAFVGSLPFDLTEAELEDFFTSLKPPKSVKIVRDREQKSKGFGYVEFEDLEKLKDALALTGSSISGRRITVRVAEAPKKRPGTASSNQDKLGGTFTKREGGSQNQDSQVVVEPSGEDAGVFNSNLDSGLTKRQGGELEKKKRTRTKRGLYTKPGAPPLPELIPLAITENRWDRSIFAGIPPDSPELVSRKARSLLNKLTATNFDSISDQIIAWANRGPIALARVVELIFEHSTFHDARFTETYARLCHKTMERISSTVQDTGIKDNQGHPVAGGPLFRTYLLHRCKDEFARIWGSNKYSAPDEKTRERGLGLIKFECELFKLQIITERIMHECAKSTLGDGSEERRVEALCVLLTRVGRILDRPTGRGHMDVYFARLGGLFESPAVCLRIRFMVQDVIQLRERQWVPRNATSTPREPSVVSEPNVSTRKGKGKGASSKAKPKVPSSTQRQQQSAASELPEPLPLTITPNRWVRISLRTTIAPDTPEFVTMKVRSLLNKLTTANFDSISDQVIAWAEKALALVVELIFEHATFNDARFTEVYARLCHKAVERPGEQLFEIYLLGRCKDEFARIRGDTGDEKTRERGLGLIRFQCELFKLQTVVTERVMHDCAENLMVGDGIDSEEERRIEALCVLLTSVGRILGHVEGYFAKLEVFNNPFVCSRIRFMVQDVIELKERGWVARIPTSALPRESTIGTSSRKGKGKATSTTKPSVQRSVTACSGFDGTAGEPKSRKTLSDTMSTPVDDRQSSTLFDVHDPQAHLVYTKARAIKEFSRVSYPEGVKRPHPKFKAGNSMGVFRYDRDFLLQFRSACKVRSNIVMPLDILTALGLDPAEPLPRPTRRVARK